MNSYLFVSLVLIVPNFVYLFMLQMIVPFWMLDANKKLLHLHIYSWQVLINTIFYCMPFRFCLLLQIISVLFTRWHETSFDGY